MDLQNDSTLQLLTKVLDASALRHQVLTNNLINADTPGYVREDVPFETTLAEAVKGDNMARLDLSVQKDFSAPARADGNNVQADNELAEINKNALLYQMTIQFMQTKLALQKMAIQGR